MTTPRDLPNPIRYPYYGLFVYAGTLRGTKVRCWVCNGSSGWAQFGTRLGWMEKHVRGHIACPDCGWLTADSLGSMARHRWLRHRKRCHVEHGDLGPNPVETLY